MVQHSRTVFCLAIALLFSGVPNLRAEDRWSVERASDPGLSAEIFAEPGERPADGLPDGLTATFSGGGDIVSAWYADPTARYRHGILGDAIEAATLRIRGSDGEVHSLGLPDNEVFEDRTPRLEDLDGDGTVEVVTIRSDRAEGASVTIYGLVEGRLRERASTGFIGRANRWLNIAGIADFRGTGRLDIAYVRTPHIGGTLFLYEFAEESLRWVGRADGFSNHVIGSTEMRLSAVADLDGDGVRDLAVPSNDRNTLHFIGFTGDAPADIGRVELPARIDKAIVVEGAGTGLRFILGLDDGGIYVVKRSTR